MQVLYRTVSLVTSSEPKQKFVGKIFVCDTLFSENFSWMEANHENNEIKSTTKIFTYTVYYIKLKSHLPICIFWNADISAVSARIETTGLALNESCVFEDHKVYFYKPTVTTVYRQECLEDEGVRSH